MGSLAVTWKSLSELHLKIPQKLLMVEGNLGFAQSISCKSSLIQMNMQKTKNELDISICVQLNTPRKINMESKHHAF